MLLAQNQASFDVKIHLNFEVLKYNNFLTNGMLLYQKVASIAAIFTDINELMEISLLPK